MDEEIASWIKAVQIKQFKDKNNKALNKNKAGNRIHRRL